MTNQSNLGVLLIDMQELFIDGVPNITDLISSQIKVLKKCAKHDIPVIAVEASTISKIPALDEPLIYSYPTLDELLIYFNKVPRRDIQSKKELNGFSNERLGKQLRSWKVEDLFLMGIYASGCVHLTALGAIEEGFKIFTSGDVLGDLVDPSYLMPPPIPNIYQRIGTYFERHEDFFLARN